MNVLAIEELKRAQYFFAYLRSSEKLYNIERRKKMKLDLEAQDEEHADIKLKSKVLEGKDNVGKGMPNVQGGKARGYMKEESQKSERYKAFEAEFQDVFEIAFK